jgi:hypothetical protein
MDEDGLIRVGRDRPAIFQRHWRWRSSARSVQCLTSISISAVVAFEACVKFVRARRYGQPSLWSVARGIYIGPLPQNIAPFWYLGD